MLGIYVSERPLKKDIDIMCIGSGIELAQNFYKELDQI